MKLKAQKTEDNLKKILEQGETLGFVYYQYVWGETSFANSLTTSTATKLLIKGDEDTDMPIHCLNVKVQDSYLILHYIKDNDDLSLMLSGLSDKWSQKYLEIGSDIDIARYTKLMINLTEMFQIKEMQITAD
jgi:hypothetical protein